MAPSFGPGLSPAWHVVGCAWLSLVGGAVEAFLAVRKSSSEDEHSFLGVGILALAEVFGAGVVLTHTHTHRTHVSKKSSDGRAASQRGNVIGMALVFLGSIWWMDSLVQSLAGSADTPPSVEGVSVALSMVVVSFSLFGYKRSTGIHLDSVLLKAHAQCSLCVGITAVGVLLTMLASTELEWAGGVLGIASATCVVYIGLALVLSMRALRESILLRDEEDAWLLPSPYSGGRALRRSSASGGSIRVVHSTEDLADASDMSDVDEHASVEEPGHLTVTI